MKKILSIIALSSLVLTGCQSTASSDSSATSSTNTSSSSVAQLLTQASSTASLVNSLTSSLDVSTEQATGGLGALLSAAGNSLPSSETSELSSLLGGVDISSLTSSVQTMADVQDTFTSLGLSTDMITTYAPIILKALTSQGASSDLISSLTSLWLG